MTFSRRGNSVRGASVRLRSCLGNASERLRRVDGAESNVASAENHAGKGESHVAGNEFHPARGESEAGIAGSRVEIAKTNADFQKNRLNCEILEIITCRNLEYP